MKDFNTPFQTMLFDKIEASMEKKYPNVDLTKVFAGIQAIKGAHEFLSEIFNVVYEQGYGDGLLGNKPFGGPDGEDITGLL